MIRQFNEYKGLSRSRYDWIHYFVPDLIQRYISINKLDILTKASGEKVERRLRRLLWRSKKLHRQYYFRAERFYCHSKGMQLFYKCENFVHFYVNGESQFIEQSKWVVIKSLRTQTNRIDKLTEEGVIQ